MLMDRRWACAWLLPNLLQAVAGAPQGLAVPVLPNAPLPVSADEVYPWAALGDSYAAGPGAGDHYDENDPDNCYRTMGSYPGELHERFAFEDPRNTLQFLACSGAKTHHMIEKQVPLMAGDLQMVTLSIGGNDIGFGGIAKACLIKPIGESDEDCEKAVLKARNIIANELENKLRTTWDAIFDKMPNKDERKVFQTLYGQFFNEDTDWCDGQYMGLLGPYLKKDLRKRMNTLAKIANDKIISSMYGYVQDKLKASSGGWTWNRLAFLNPDMRIYEGRRFCEPGIESLDDESIAFFKIRGNDATVASASAYAAGTDPKTCAEDPKYEDEDIFLWKCDIARYIEQNPDAETVFFPGEENFLKAFHPKSFAFTYITDGVKYAVASMAFPRERPVTNGGTIQCHSAVRGVGDPKHFFSRETALKAIDEFCSPSNGAAEALQPSTSDHHGLHLSFKPLISDCTANDGPPLIGPGGWREACVNGFKKAIDECDHVKGDSDLWKQGGFFHHRKCFVFSLAKAPVRPLTVEAMDAWNWDGFHW